MAVIPKVGYTQSLDAKTLTLIDESDYTSGDINNYTRSVQLWSGKDSTGQLIAELPFIGNNLTVDYTISHDQYFSCKLVMTGSPAVVPKLLNFGTTQFEYNALDKLLLVNCGCSKKGKCCDKITYGSLYLKRAEDQVLFGNSAKFNSFIQSSLQWLQN